jgi:hypothetical protein
MATRTFWQIAAGCGVALSIASAAAFAADNIAYMGTVAGEFGTIDLNTGVFSILGNSGQTLAGMAVTNGMLYASSYHVPGKLFTVNPANGSVTLVGNSTSLVYDDFGSTTSGLYAIGTDAALYSINSTTGAETFIGPTGLTFGSWRALSTNSNTLYFANGPNLYTINRNTGAPTLVGSMGGPQIGALVEGDGQLYGGADSPSLQVATLNITTGLATIGPSLTGSSSPFYAIAPYPLPSAAGDYNHNGVIDAPDYVTWRDGLGTVFTQSDYSVWRAHFGQTAGSGALTSVAVPESTATSLIALGVALFRAKRRDRNA